MKYLNVNYRSWSYQDSQKSYKTTLAVITQPQSLHYVFISYNMKPHSLEFLYLEREDSYTRKIVVAAKLKF